MPVNEFEKQVQQKMDELQLHPSGEVWKEVEKHIRKEKKRRRVIFWVFLFAAILAGGAAWWNMNGNRQSIAGNEQVLPATTGNTTTLTEPDKNKIPLQDNNITVNNTTDQQKKTGGAAIDSNSSTINIQITAGKKSTANPSRNDPSSASQLAMNYQRAGIGKKGNKPVNDQSGELVLQLQDATKDVSSKPVADNKALDKEEKNNKTIISKDLAVTPPAETIHPAEPVTISNDKKTIPVSTDSTVLKTPVASTRKTDKNKKHKWEFGANIFAGNVETTSSISFFSSQKRNDNLASGPGNTMQRGPVINSSPTAPGTGLAIQTGIYAKRKLSARTGVSIGLDFSSFSTKQRTGILINNAAVIQNSVFSSSVSDYYSSGTGAAHTNHYYYLELPLSFHWQLNKGVKLPLVWKNGFSTGILAGSNAMIYSPASTVFYRDNRLLNKMQFSYQSGFYARLLNKTHHPFTIGVVYNYHFSRLQKVDTYGGNHLSSVGIQAGWILKK